MRREKSKVYAYTAKKSNGLLAIWRVYADSEEEAEATAKWMCRLFDAVYLGNLSGGRKCMI